MAATTRTIDDYLATLSASQRKALQHLRAVIHAAAPDATECISYGVPAFRTTRVVVGFGATATHCALYLFSGTTVAKHAAKLAAFDVSKGTVRFPPDAPLPDALVRTLVADRLADIAGR